jgi:hypothetical protein
VHAAREADFSACERRLCLPRSSEALPGIETVCLHNHSRRLLERKFIHIVALLQVGSGDEPF